MKINKFEIKFFLLLSIFSIAPRINLSIKSNNINKLKKSFSYFSNFSESNNTNLILSNTSFEEKKSFTNKNNNIGNKPFISELAKINFKKYDKDYNSSYEFLMNKNINKQPGQLKIEEDEEKNKQIKLIKVNTYKKQKIGFFL